MLTPVGVTAADYTNAILSGAATHARITFSNGVVLGDQDIDSSGLLINDVLNGDTNLTFGRAVMKEISIPLIAGSRLDGISWTDEFTLDMGVDISGTTYWVTVGIFRGTRPNKIHYVEVIDFNAYDRMQLFDTLATDFLDRQTWPLTFSTMLSNLCSYVGITYAQGDELANIKTRSFDRNFINAEGLTCRNLLAMMAEACGCYARITADGKLKMVWYSDPSYVVADTSEFGIEAYDLGPGKTWGDIATDTWNDESVLLWVDLGGYQAVFSVDGLRSVMSDQDIGVGYGTIDGNVYTIVDNPFLAIYSSSDPATYVKPLFTRLQSFGGYLPVSVECIGNWLVETGDILTVDVHGENVKMPLFCRDMLWNGGCTDRYETTGDTQRPALSSEASVKLTNGGKFHEYRNDIDILSSRMGDAEGNISTLQQTTSGLSVEVSQKARVFYSNTAPTGSESDPLETGDLWIDTGNNNQMKRWNGSSWEDASFDDPDKYTVRSGIDIKATGIEISGSKYIEMKSGTEIDIDSGGKLDVKSGGDIDVESGGDINVNNGANLNVKSGGDIEIENGGDINIASGGKIDVASGGDIDIESGADINIKNGGKLDVASGGDIDIESGGDINIKNGANLNVKSGGDIEIENGGDINVASGGKISVASGGDIDIESGADINIKSGGKLSLVAGGTVDIQATNFTIDSANKKIVAEDVTFDNYGVIIDKEDSFTQQKTRFILGSKNELDFTGADEGCALQYSYQIVQGTGGILCYIPKLDFVDKDGNNEIRFILPKLGFEGEISFSSSNGQRMNLGNNTKRFETLYVNRINVYNGVTWGDLKGFN